MPDTSSATYNGWALTSSAVVGALAGAALGAVASWAIADLTTSRMLKASEASQAADLNARLDQWQKENTIGSKSLEEEQEANRAAQERFLAEMTAQDQRHQRELDAFARLIELNSQSIEAITGKQDDIFDELSAQATAERLQSQNQQTRDRVFSYIQSARELQSAIVTLEGTSCREIITRETTPIFGMDGRQTGSGTSQHRDRDCSTFEIPKRELMRAMSDYETSLAIALVSTEGDAQVIGYIRALNASINLGGLKTLMQTPTYAKGLEAFILDNATFSSAAARIDRALE